MQKALCCPYLFRYRGLTKTLLIMKLTGFLLLAACMQVSAAGYSQKVTLSEKNAPLQKIFREIKKQTDYSFFFDESWLQQAGRVTIDVKEAPLEKALELCFKNQPLTWSVIGKTIIVKLKEEPVVAGAPLPPIEIGGTITDEDGIPLNGVSISVKGVAKGVTTNAKGEFSITGVDDNAVLVFSFVGFESQEIPVEKRKSFYLRLKRSNKALDETFVIGYGTSTKRYSTGSVSRVTSEEIARQPITNVLQALEGRLPGVFITQSNGLPGTAMTVQVRGQNSLINNLQPLYIVDGVQFNATAINTQTTNSIYGANGYPSPMNSINPADIESIEILKDADATSIYGARGANGVILVTTKKGKPGRTQVNITVNSGQSHVSKFLPTLSTERYLAIRKQAFINDGITPTVANAPDLKLWSQTAQTDFQKMLIGNTAHTTDATVSVSGGDLRTRFLLSSSYHHETTVFIGNQGYKRGSLNLNVDHSSVDKKFNIAVTALYTADANDITLLDLTNDAYTLPPNFPLYDSLGNLYWGGKTNPLAQLRKVAKSKITSLMGNAALRYTIIPGLDVKANLGYSKMEMNQVQLNYSASYDPSSNIASNSVFSITNTQNYLIEPQLVYNGRLSKGRIQLLAGGTYQHNVFNQPMYVLASGFASDDLLENVTAATTRSYNSSFGEYKYVSGFGRVNYNWDGKYVVNLNFRRDGSSRFGQNRRFGNFGSAAAAWIFTEEKGLKLPGWLSFGKLRGSYGAVGNDPSTNYNYLESFSSSLAYDSVTSLIPTRIANADYQWEINRKLELALELGLLQDRVFLTTAWFYNRTTNQLVSYPLTPQTGFNAYLANIPAVILNQGLEVTMTSTNIKKKDFTWTSTFNITIPQNKLVSFAGLANTSYASNYLIGKPLSKYLLYHYIGLDSTGLPAVEDVNKSGTYSGGAAANNKGDYVYAGKSYPDYYGGLNNSFRYKGFQLDIMFQYVKQTGRSLISGTFYPPGLSYNMSDKLLDNYFALKTVNPGVLLTSTTGKAYTAYSRYGASDASLSDASFIRLKNVNLSYAFSSTQLKRFGLQSLRVYMQAQNLFTFTHYLGFDPESQGVVLPPLRTISAGIQCSL